MTQPTSTIVLAARAAQKDWKVPASVSIAQYADESGWGVHDLGCFNYGGIKAPLDAHGNPTVRAVLLATHEVVNGHVITIHAWFRKFTSPADFFDFHAKLLATAPVYAAAMKALPSVPNFVAAMAPHYATDPLYAHKLMAIINGSKLTNYDIQEAA